MKIDEKTNRILHICDNLRVMRGMDSNTVDLIATDPPFNTKRQFNAPLGSKAAGQRFNDRWKWDDVTDEWNELIAVENPAIKEIVEAAVVIEGGTVDRLTGHIDTGRTKNSVAAFLVWMAPRLVEMKRILKDTGSIYLHCDPTASHYLKLLMDAVFGCDNFRNEIIWHYHMGSSSKKDYRKKHDTLLFYSRSEDYVGVQVRVPRRMEGRYNHVDEDGRKYHINGAGKRFYADEGIMPDDVWSYLRDKKFTQLNSQAKERVGWRTQKPWKLYQRIVKASSKEGDLVLDPFCGCATTCVAAELEGRRWIGVDIDPVAATVTKTQLEKAVGAYLIGEGEDVKVMINRPPTRTDIPHLNKDQMRQTLWNKHGGICHNPYCRVEMRLVDVHVDHIIPKIRGGSDDISNRSALCGNCNQRKGKQAWKVFLDKERAKQPHLTIG